MGGLTNGVIDISWRGKPPKYNYIVYRDEVVFDSDNGINRLTPEIIAYIKAVDCEDGEFEEAKK